MELKSQAINDSCRNENSIAQASYKRFQVPKPAEIHSFSFIQWNWSFPFSGLTFFVSF